MKLKIGLLGSNLQELYSTKDNANPVLVASPFRKKIFNSSSGWGRVYSALYLVLGKNRRAKRLHTVVVHTHDLFNEHAKFMQGTLEQYHQYVAQASKGQQPNAKQYLRCRWVLTRWYDATHVFLDNVHKQPNSPLQEFLKSNLLSSPKDPSPFTCEPLFKRVSCVQKILDIEGLFQKPLPYAALHKLATSAQLTQQERDDIDKWIQFLNVHSKKFSVHFFHRFLKSLINEFPQGGPIPNLTKLEMGLVDRECKIFLQRDLKHLSWREQLRPGNVVLCNSKQIVLGERIGVKKEGFDQTIHFAVVGDPHKIFTVGVNEAILGLKKALSEEQGFAVRMASYIEIDASGKCALVEKLSESLNQYPWTSQKDQLSAADQDLISPLSGLINWFVKEKISPHHLSPRHLMFDAAGELKSLKLVLKTPSEDFDFNFLENFVCECAAGNRRVFQHLMEASGLHEHPYAKFYEKIVKNALQRNTTTVSMQADLDSITDSRIEEQAQKLYQQISELEMECVQKIQQQCQIAPQKLISAVSKQIYSQYQMSSGAGIIWPGLKQDVIEAVIKQQNLTVFVEDSGVDTKETHTLPSIAKGFFLLDGSPGTGNALNDQLFEGLIAS
jgi:hypothetical protein